MNILCIDTANGNCTIIISKNQTIFSSHNANEPNPSEKLFDGIHDLMRQAEITYSQIDIVGVCIGPGSFNGTRIAMSAAIGITQVIEKPMTTINILELFIYSQNQLRDCGRAVSVIDAKKNQFCYQAFSNYCTPITDMQLGNQEDMSRFLATIRPTAIITNAEPSNFTPFESKILVPDPALMCQLAQVNCMRKKPIRAEPLYLRPLYLRS